MQCSKIKIPILVSLLIINILPFNGFAQKNELTKKYNYFVSLPSLGLGVTRDFVIRNYKIQPFFYWSIGLEPNIRAIGFNNDFILQIVNPNPLKYLFFPSTSFGFNFTPKQEFFLTERLEPYLCLAMDRPGPWPNDFRIGAGLFYHINDRWLFYYESNAFINVIGRKLYVQDVDKGLWVYRGMRLGFRYYFRK